MEKLTSSINHKTHQLQKAWEPILTAHSTNMLIYTPGIYPLISSVFPATIAIMIMMKMMIIIITYFIYFLPSYNCKCHYSYYRHAFFVSVFSFSSFSILSIRSYKKDNVTLFGFVSTLLSSLTFYYYVTISYYYCYYCAY